MSGFTSARSRRRRRLHRRTRTQPSRRYRRRRSAPDERSKPRPRRSPIRSLRTRCARSACGWSDEPSCDGGAGMTLGARIRGVRVAITVGVTVVSWLVSRAFGWDPVKAALVLLVPLVLALVSVQVVLVGRVQRRLERAFAQED